MKMRRHGWQRPLHPLQIVGMSIFGLLVVSFYCFLGLFLGNKIAEITVTTIFSFAALSAALVFIRCTSIDPTDKTSFRLRKKKKKHHKSITFSKLNYRLIIAQILARFFRRLERKILRTFIRRKYVLMDPPMEPLLLPFTLVVKDDSSVDPKLEDISFCALCDFQVQKHSKHCRTCNRCVEGFDHHCRWLNNCVGKKNYTTFILLMIFLLIMLIIEGGTALAIFIRCFADRKGIEQELLRRHYIKFPRGLLAAISVLLVLMTAYSSAALGQLFFFHVLLIRKGMRTYDYILAMKEEEEKQFMELDSLEDSDYSSDDSIDSNSPENPRFVSRFICGRAAGMSQNSKRLSIRIDRESETLNKQHQQQGGYQVSINPWKLITMSKEKALLAVTKAKEKLIQQKNAMVVEHDSLKPLPLETKSGPSIKPPDKSADGATTEKERLPGGSPGKFSSPRRRFSCSPGSKNKYNRSNFDLQLTQVSRELETYISRQVLSSVLRKGGEASPKYN